MTIQNAPIWSGVLFDLDGTLADSAPDLGGAGNDLRARRGLDPLPLNLYRPLTGTGARGMLQVALQMSPDHPEFNATRDEYLDIYAARLTQDTRLFQQIPPLLIELEARGLPWGVVTNKHSRFAQPLLQGLNLTERAATLICGDTLPRAKPHPDPLIEAARRMEIPPEACIYVGDDLRDIQAGRAAGMVTVAASWGYLGHGAPVEQWGADHLISFPLDLLKLPGLS